jgi:hypothetical protein
MDYQNQLDYIVAVESGVFVLSMMVIWPRQLQVTENMKEFCWFAR